MNKLPRISGKEVIKTLGKQGFQFARQKGSHVILKKESDAGTKAVVVPLSTKNKPLNTTR